MASRHHGHLCPNQKGRLFLAVVAFGLFVGLTGLRAADVDLDGAVQVPEGGYMYVRDHDDLSDASECLTIEAWVWLTDVPGDNRHWPLVIKQGSWWVSFDGRDMAGPFPEADKPAGTMLLMFHHHESREDGGCGSGSGLRFIPDEDPWPIEEWVHIANQVWDGNGKGADQVRIGGAHVSGGGGTYGVGKSDSPLYIGGIRPHAELVRGSPTWLWDSPDTVQSVDGWLDEVRISRGFRNRGVQGRPLRRGQGPDENTVALWTFDDPPDRGRYADESGNGHSLFLGGTLAVTARSRFATTWAQIKRG